MSRILVYGLNNLPVGEVRAICKRGWAINDGGSTSFILPADMADAWWVQMGRMVCVTHPKLPTWAGVIDCPWDALPPVTVTAYDVPYLLSLRCPEEAVKLTGTLYELVTQLIDMANGYEELYLEVGKVDKDDTVRELEVDEKPIWEHLTELVETAGMEMMFRSEIREDNRLMTYIDIRTELGKDTGFMLQDGQGGNCTITDAKVDGDIWNRIICQTGQSTKQSQLTSGPVIDNSSIRTYRLRNTVMTLKSEDQGTLDIDTDNALAYYKAPRLVMTIDVLDKGRAFGYLRLGNTVRVRSTRVVLPGGRHGWDGDARIMAMAYDEGKNTVSMTVEGEL